MNPSLGTVATVVQTMVWEKNFRETKLLDIVFEMLKNNLNFFYNFFLIIKKNLIFLKKILEKFYVSSSQIVSQRHDH